MITPQKCKKKILARFYIAYWSGMCSANYGVGVNSKAEHPAIHAANAELQAAKAGVAAIIAAGTVPNVNPAAVKQSAVVVPQTA